MLIKNARSMPWPELKARLGISSSAELASLLDVESVIRHPNGDLEIPAGLLTASGGPQGVRLSDKAKVNHLQAGDDDESFLPPGCFSAGGRSLTRGALKL